MELKLTLNIYSAKEGPFSGAEAWRTITPGIYLQPIEITTEDATQNFHVHRWFCCRGVCRIVYKGLCCTLKQVYITETANGMVFWKLQIGEDFVEQADLSEANFYISSKHAVSKYMGAQSKHFVLCSYNTMPLPKMILIFANTSTIFILYFIVRPQIP